MKKAWMTAMTKGSKSLQTRLAKIHANNPEFQEFVKKHGFGGNLSAKQSEKYKTSSIASVAPVTNAHPDTKIGTKEREDMIRQAVERTKHRRQANANRVAFGGELGGGFQLPRSGFRRYSESLGEAKKKIVLGKKIPQLPEPKGGHPVPKGFKRIKDPQGFNVLQKIKEGLNQKLGAKLDMKKKDYLPFDPDPPKKNPGVTAGKRPIRLSRARWLARMAMNKQSKKEDASITNKKKTLTELKKSTLASYITKAAPAIRADTSIYRSLDADAGESLRKANKYHPLNFDPNDPESKNKDIELSSKYDKEYKINKDLANTFARGARNRIKGIKRAAGKLAKEEITIEEGKNPYGTGFKLVHAKTGQVYKVGDKFRDEDEHKTHAILGWQHGSQRGNPNSSGRVRVKVGGKKGYEHEYFPSVFNMKIVKEDSNINETLTDLSKAKKKLWKKLDRLSDKEPTVRHSWDQSFKKIKGGPVHILTHYRGGKIVNKKYFDDQEMKISSKKSLEEDSAIMVLAKERFQSKKSK